MRSIGHRVATRLRLWLGPVYTARSMRAHRIAARLTLCLGLALAALAPVNGLAATESVSPLDCVSRLACRIVDVYVVVFWVAMFVLVVVGGLIVYAALRFRRRDDAEPRQVHGNTRLEMAWTAIPSLMLVVIFFLTLTSMGFVRNGPNPDLTVKVTGQQFAWTFEYPNGKKAATEMVIPTGKVVRLEVTSKDVLHAFWVPRVGGQIYAVPGQMNHGWIEADQPGTYLGECNELCGTYHYSMQLVVRAQNQADFMAWYTSKGPPPSTAVASKVQGVPAASKVSETDSLQFQPGRATVKVGEVVEWSNAGNTPHNVTFDNKQVPTSDTMNGGDTYEVKFSKPGTYHYICTFHTAAGMAGTITVTP